MTCIWCGGKTEFRKTVFVQEGQTTNDLRVVTEVPAEICRQCDEKTFAPEVAEELYRLCTEADTANAEVSVPLLRFNSSQVPVPPASSS